MILENTLSLKELLIVEQPAIICY